MRLPVAIVVSVFVWSAARYLPTYYLELRKMDLEEEKAEAQLHVRAAALARDAAVPAQASAQAAAPKHAGFQRESRFY